MIKPFFALFLLAISSCSTAQNTMKKESKVIFEIDFQDFFDNDTITVKVNNCAAFKNIKLTSNKSIGLTDVKVVAYPHGNKQAKIVVKDSFVICNYSPDQISLFISLNGYEKEYAIDLRKGTYLGFSKKNTSDFTFIQSVTPFQYD